MFHLGIFEVTNIFEAKPNNAKIKLKENLCYLVIILVITKFIFYVHIYIQKHMMCIYIYILYRNMHMYVYRTIYIYIYRRSYKQLLCLLTPRRRVDSIDWNIES